ncbi:hypothetical protein M3194_05140 [Paenibacillus glycanilyticus]|uniref:hypothetical protein n=1 Tax=Paenibacillus glycanilyticus TaxID=126569 RepID=UPI0020420D8A|nr:hypothetical protein [Paenibacillus glycanilyticus]MCM3626746.1 hypothetical protein [Paenibacillus glycanilyticus]
MKFRGTNAIIVWSIMNVASIIMSLIYLNILISIILMIVLIYAIIHYFSYDVEIKESKIIVKTFFIKKQIFDISTIKLIHAITTRKAGYIEIQIGKSYPEEFYILVFKNNSKFKINAHLKYKGTSFGRYLKKHYHIPFKEFEETKYIYGNP